MKLIDLCERIQRMKKWYIPLIALTVVLFLGFLPAFIRLIVAAAVLTLGLVYYVYRTHGPDGMDKVYARVPVASDGRASTILIDASLLDEGTRMRCAAQPINVMPELSMKMGSGALLLGAAMTLLAQEMSPQDSAAAISAAKALNISNGLLRSRSPVLSRSQHNGITAITVRDGQRDRVYYMGEPLKLAALCGSIHEDRVRYITHNDRERIDDTERYIRTAGCRVVAYATAASGEKPTFLGMIGLGDGLREEALSEARKLRRLGFTLMLRDDGAVPVDMDALHEALDLQKIDARPDLFLCAGARTKKRLLPDPGNSRCLTILPGDGPLSEPVARLAGYLTSLNKLLTRLTAAFGAVMLAALMGGSGLCLAGAALMMYAGLYFYGHPREDVRVSRAAVALVAGAALLGRLFLSTVPSGMHAGGFMAFLIAGAVAFGLSGRKPSLQNLKPVLIILGALFLLQLLLSLGAMPGLLLPAFFACICGALGGVGFLLMNR